MATQTIKALVKSTPGLRSSVQFLRNLDLRQLSLYRFDVVETLLVDLLSSRIRWKIWNDWQRTHHPPHFSYNNYGAFILAFFRNTVGPYSFYRGFLSFQMIRDGDKVLDISCGDGFFSKRYLATNASRVDAIDIEPDAIVAARKYNDDPKVRFYQIDAVTQPFPDTGYDVVVWDGGIAHFAKETNEAMIAKIKAHLKPDGVFCGSETLGFDGSEDHLQRWDTVEEVAAMLKPHFKHVDVLATDYFYNLAKTARRGEFYWRCADSLRSLDSAAWKRF